MTKVKVMGPVDYLMVRFPGNKFSGKAAPELLRLEKKGIIRVIDMVFIMKDENGKLVTSEAVDLTEEARAAFNELSKNTREWFSQGDIEEIATSLPNNSTAGLLLFENVWATQFKEDLLEMNAEVIDMGRIPPENIQKVEKEMAKRGDWTMRGRGIALVAGARMGQARAEQAAAQQAAQQAPQAAAPASTDTAAEIQKLADLHASGALTDEEFAAMKKKLLGL
jgi:uncharacterized membrane protein